MVDRVLSDDHGREKPFGFYMVVLLLGMAPWLHLWPPLIAGAWRRLAPSRAAIGPGRKLRGFATNLRALEPTALFALLWVGLPMAVFSIAGSKMYLYVTPLMVPFSLWMGRLHIERWPDILPDRRPARLIMLAIGFIWCLAALGFKLMPDRAPTGKSYVSLAQAVSALPLSPGEPLNIEDGRPDSITFYSGRPLMGRPDDVSISPYLRMLADRAQDGPTFLLTKEDGLEDMEEREMKWREIKTQGEWSLVEILGGPTTKTTTQSAP